MKYFVTISLIILSNYALGQTRPSIEYKEGSRKLMKLLGNAYFENSLGLSKDEPDTNLQFLSILFTVDSVGRVGDQFFTTLVGDTVKMPPLLIDVIKKTSGNWINHVGRTLWVEQSFSYRYMDPNKPQLVLPARMDIYEKGIRIPSSDIVILDPIPCSATVPVY